MLMDSLVQLRAPIKNKQLKLWQKARWDSVGREVA